MAARNRFVPRPMSFELLFLELREPLKGLWFECFHALKIDKATLLQVRDKYAKDPKMCVVEALRLWLINTDPPPSWDNLVQVLRYVVMETELADRIERLYVDPAKAERPPAPKNALKLTYEDVRLSFGPPGPGYDAFVYMFTEVMDLFNDASTCYILHFAVRSLCCPDASPYIDFPFMRSKLTIDGLMMPLILYHYISDIDVDMLVYLLKAIGQLEAINSSLEVYYSQRTLGQPGLRKIRNIQKLFLVCCVFEPGQPGNTDFQVVVDLKKQLVTNFGLENYPYIMQFMGWSNNPVTFHFQLPQTVMPAVRNSLKSFPDNLKEMHIKQVDIEVGSGRFHIASQQ